ncbi:LLM class flavin-dependent oxidoreductase [Solwaraspora sp. WMMD1047]|uniref:LLM class flavin-dependent oxidoreductase n=1 Tax=Solwaraspora sp. WMMD1047 TaxID=3016102 RepID=UPI0024169E86|nr:LLM class flavin-dependent oxidoreductase [Solwaraspora sp. WMMD1047]MDG4834420.1 LLM class flavin-dependent oxidoreductase [Solwaraspora sp. WMMD1047]
MDVGILLDLRNPADWRRPWSEHYDRTIELVREAERRGAGSVWLTEHHLFEDGYLPQPLTLAAALATRTSRIRIGTGILLGALRHPLHIAEQAALVDVLSAGRLELGFGAGWSRAEYAAFDIDFDRRFRRTDHTLVEVERLLRETVRPPAVQQPVPLWLGYQGPRGARRAGRLGVGLLALDGALLEPYQTGLADGGHDPARARMGGLLDVIVAADPERTTDRLLPYVAHQANSYRQGKARAEGRQIPALTVDDLRATVRSGGQLPGITVRTPDDAIRAIRAQLAGLPARHVYCWGSVAGMPDDLVEEHLDLLLGVVRPALGGADRAGVS